MSAIIGHPYTRLFFELFAPVFVLFAQALQLRYLDGHYLRADGELRVVGLLIAAALALLAYALLRLIVAPLLSAVAVVSATLVLRLMSNIKLATTDDPLAWTDISVTTNISVVWRYLSIEHIIILAAVVLVGVVTWLINPFRTRSWKMFGVNGVLCLSLIPVALFPYFGRGEEGLFGPMRAFFVESGFSYRVWDSKRNIESNGLLVHLVQTSQREMPEAPTDAEALRFQELLGSRTSLEKRPSNIIVVLCEACWHDEHFFKDSFRKLSDIGYTGFRSVSPVYGGATVNATFELVTGLPAEAVLTGVVYQEYADVLSDQAFSWPRQLKKLGYRTLAVHNHYRKFWKRDVVNRKLGYDRFIGLEDMLYDGTPWADDGVLYDTVLAELQAQPNDNFFFLTTVSTHGPYRFDEDFGEGDYQRRLDKALDELASFTQQVMAIESDTMIFVVGDHKPALTRFFFERGVMPATLFRTTGETNADFKLAGSAPGQLIGDVPGYIIYRDSAKIERFVEVARDMPFYCAAYAMDQVFTRSGLPAFAFVDKHSLCGSYDVGGYESVAKQFPPWLYSASLFNGKK